MKIPRNAIERTVTALLETGARKATYYLAPDTVVKATRQHRPDKRSRSTTIVLTFGVPAFRERRFIAACQRAGESFPMRNVHLQFYPPPKRK